LTSSLATLYFTPAGISDRPSDARAIAVQLEAMQKTQYGTVSCLDCLGVLIERILVSCPWVDPDGWRRIVISLIIQMGIRLHPGLDDPCSQRRAVVP
jgi:hypothetical protein